MAQLFPKWTNQLPTYAAMGGLVIVVSIVGFIWYYFSPWYTDVGYKPVQPVQYSHKTHADDLGLDCRYCHNFVEESPHANIPPTQTCMNCHTIIKAESDTLLPVRESWLTNKPIEWVRIHELPDYVYFDHSIHLNAGVGCFSCHGNIDKMVEVKLAKPLSMSWCLDCHRDPAMHLRPVTEITNMDWEPPANQTELGHKIMEERNILPTIDCSGCHR